MSMSMSMSMAKALFVMALMMSEGVSGGGGGDDGVPLEPEQEEELALATTRASPIGYQRMDGSGMFAASRRNNYYGPNQGQTLILQPNPPPVDVAAIRAQQQQQQLASTSSFGGPFVVGQLQPSATGGVAVSSRPSDAVDCRWNSWGTWGNCIRNQQMRTRTLAYPAINGGSCDGPSEQTRRC